MGAPLRPQEAHRTCKVTNVCPPTRATRQQHKHALPFMVAFSVVRGGFGLDTMGLGVVFGCVSGGQLGFVSYRVGFWGSVGRVWA